MREQVEVGVKDERGRDDRVDQPNACELRRVGWERSQLLLRQRYGTVRMASRSGGHVGAYDERDSVGRIRTGGNPSCDLRITEKLERKLIVPQRIFGAADCHCLVARLDAGVRGGDEVVRRASVAGQLGCRSLDLMAREGGGVCRV